MSNTINSNPPLAISHAPTERAEPHEIVRQVKQLDADGNLGRLIDSLPNLVAVLNMEHQILLGNLALAKCASDLKVEHLTGLRFGEILLCRHAVTAEFGCGTSEVCRTCGALQAIQDAQAGRLATEECRIATATGEALDLRITATPLAWYGRNQVLFVAEDISDEKRRQVLERIFFHDVLNTASRVAGLAALIAREPQQGYELKDELLGSAKALFNDIKSQRLLLVAESGELKVQPAVLEAAVALKGVQQIYRDHPAGAGKRVGLDLGGTNFSVKTDPLLLHHVLSNLLKNALEASQPGAVVWLGAESVDGACRFWCHNTGEIPRLAALQVFQRNFTTKGPGRGIGTYGSKLLGERYLRGRLSFTTSEEDGTRFHITLPLEL